jgi:hypothetical protein
VELEKLHALPVELLEVLKENMPYSTGGPAGWNFEKAHSILHKVRDILLFGWSENFSHQGPEHGHIDKCKRLANCTNNKEVYLTVLRAYSSEGHLQYPWSLEAERVMVLRNLCLLLLLKRSVMLLLVNWVSVTQHYSRYTLGN